MIKVLVADDERWIRKGIIKMLDWEQFEQQEYGPFQIFEADTVDFALEIYRQHQMEIVISDVKFPIEDGCYLCERIYEENPQVKIMMISGYNEFSYVKRALQYRAVDYLLKPVDKSLLNTTFLKCLSELRGALQYQKEKAQQEHNLASKDFGDTQCIILESMQTIKKNYQEKYSLAEFAKKYNISEAYFSVIFKKYSGLSLTTFIMRVKVEKAIELMITTKHKICDISEMVGYEDQHYFTKVFKKITGKSPREYRDALRRELTEEEAQV